MSLEDVLKRVKNGFYKEVVQKARAAYEETVKRNKTDLVCFVGNPPTVCFDPLNNT